MREYRASQISVIKSNFDNITYNELIRIEKEWQEDESKCNIGKNLQDAILCYYLNSSYARFNEHLSFSNNHNRKKLMWNQLLMK